MSRGFDSPVGLSLELFPDGCFPGIRGGRRAVAAQVAGEGCALLPRPWDGLCCVAAEHGGGRGGQCSGAGEREERCLHAIRQGVRGECPCLGNVVFLIHDLGLRLVKKAGLKYNVVPTLLD